MSRADSVTIAPVHLEIHAREPLADNYPFGDVGTYEVITATAHYAVDPDIPTHRSIADLDLVQRESDGMIRFSGDVEIYRPTGGGRQRLFFDWGNRGSKRAFEVFCDAVFSNRPRTLTDTGNAYLMRRGYTIVFGGWQGDLLPGDERMLVDIPVAMRGGQPLRGLRSAEFIVTTPTWSVPLSGWTSTRSLPVTRAGERTARLTRKRYPHSQEEELPADGWRFARLQGGTSPDPQEQAVATVPSREDLYVEDGLKPGWIYELTYEAESPLVLGLAHVVVRDLVSYLRYDPSEPAGPIEHAYGWGRSQAGRAIRDFIYHGFNEDLAGRPVFDGVLPHVAGAGRLDTGRFASLTVPGGQQFEDHLSSADTFPFAYAETVDHLTGARDAIMKRTSDPKVLDSQTSTEYWQRRGSLVHTTTDGRDDLPFPPNVRCYMWSSTQHYASPSMASPPKGICNHVGNVVATSALFRALLEALDAWVSQGTEPPPSMVPTVADGTLVSMNAWDRQFPAIPSVVRPAAPNELCVVDHSVTPSQPDRSRQYAVLVPAVDSDGNEIAGVRTPMVAAPLGTYTGWNTRGPGQGYGALHDFSGATLPFAVTEDERLMIDDPRPSVEERYGDCAGYVAAIKVAAQDLVGRRFLLEEDVERAVAAAANWSAPRHAVDLP